MNAIDFSSLLDTYGSVDEAMDAIFAGLGNEVAKREAAKAKEKEAAKYAEALDQLAVAYNNALFLALDGDDEVFEMAQIDAEGAHELMDASLAAIEMATLLDSITSKTGKACKCAKGKGEDTLNDLAEKLKKAFEAYTKD